MNEAIYNITMTITTKVKQILNRYHTNNPDQLAKELGIIVLPRAFKRQKGVYKIIERNRFIFITSQHSTISCCDLL